jgi:prephenate dehydrogenase
MKQVAIVGLIGGSFGLALKRDVSHVEVVGVTRRKKTAELAVKRGAVDRAGVELGALRGADMVVLAAPLALTPALLRDIASHLAPGARVTDVGSVKGWVVWQAAGALDKGNPFLGGHPMAGKEVTGIEAAEPDLFRGRPWIFTPRRRKEMDRFGDLVDAVKAIGARPLVMSPEEHDRYVALVSHIPFLLSAAYLRAVGAEEDWDVASGLASSGFRDISRLGAGDSDMYAAIADANREEVLRAWATLHIALDEFEAAIARADGDSLLDLLLAARQTRVDWAAEHPELT